ncbi:uncharacterized protein LOC115887035 [Sitophilus oryzae]|uniref:Uncharacterized protein LOC115887035 n=1 Tax=Sitophilus oryzae TaxID=7048 RepID=A0A6J2YFX1_SITOR|nr:uncharacterized protein LOC115887035 [Sitophilus oryzae]
MYVYDAYMFVVGNRDLFAGFVSDPSYLAEGCSMQEIAWGYRLGKATVHIIIKETCGVLWEKLQPLELPNPTKKKTPTTAADWLNIAKDFESTCNIPNVIGAMDGKHIVFRAPKIDGSMWGVNGRVSDGGVYCQSTLAKAIAQNYLNIPEDRCLPGRNKLVPHVILADAAFPLGEHIMKPYPFRNLTNEQKIYNYRLSRGRRVVENAFGILANRFRISLTTINLSAQKVQIITLAARVLHSSLSAENLYMVNDDGEIDDSYVFKYGLSQQSGNRAKD